MKIPASIFLLILFIHVTGAWLLSAPHLYFLPQRWHANKIEISTQYQHRHNSIADDDGLHPMPTDQKFNSKRKNPLLRIFQFLLYHIRHLLYPGLSKNFDSNMDAPLPELAPLGCPFFGNNILAGSQKNGPEYFYSKTSAKLGHPRIWRFYFMGIPVVSLSGSRNIDAVLRNKKFNIVPLTPDFNSGLPSAEGRRVRTSKKKKELYSSNSVMFEGDRDKHRFLRRLVGAAFQPHAVQAGITKIVQAAEQQIARVSVREKMCIMENVCESFALDIAWRQIIGLDLEEDEEEIQRFHKAVNQYVSGVFSVSAYLNFPGKTLLPPYKARKYLVSKIEERIRHLNQNGPDGSTLSAMVFSSDEDTKKKLTHEDIVENALILLAAGTETTSSTLTSAIFFLGLNPAIWDKLVQEQKEVISAHGTNITKSALDECTYMDAVIKETLRLAPISGVNLRRAEEPIILDGKQIPKGTSVFCNIRLTHELDPTIRSNSSMDPRTEFTPHRWFDSKTRPDKDFIPFGAGSRRCLGESLAMMEMRIFISVFARRVENFELSGVGTEKKSIRWNPASIIPKPLDGVPISSTSRLHVSSV